MRAAAIPIEEIDPVFTGKRRQVSRTPSLPLIWPNTSKARYDLFDAWHGVAMQYARLNGVGLRFLAVSKIVMRWNQQAITATNQQLADRAGYCSIETIRREIAALRDLGLLSTKGGGRRHPDGIRIIRTRTIRLAVPTNMDPRIKLPDGDFETETD